MHMFSFSFLISYIIVSLAAHHSHTSRDAVAKILYLLLFRWLTERINGQVYPHQHTLSISILDIYGFEVTEPCCMFDLKPLRKN